MTLILSNEDVAELLPMRECIDVLEDAYVELSEGRGVSRVRSDCLVPAARGDAIYSLKSMDGVVPKLGIGAVRIDSDIVTWPKAGGDMRRVKVPAAPGRRYVGLVLLFSVENGEPLAIFPDGVMQRIRVGATNGLGVKYLARKEAKSVGILGSGWQAGTQLTAVCAVRKIEIIRCFSPNREHCAAFAKEMGGVLGIEIVAVGTAEEAIGSADIVMCATNSIEPVFLARWIAPGMHLSAIKLPEIEGAAVARADRLVIHTHDAKPLHVAAKGLASPETGEGKGWAAGRGIDFGRVPTLADLITGKALGRGGGEAGAAGADREVTCFINNLGLGYQFAAAGAVVYRNAKRRGLGRELPTEWLTQDVHP
jgi:ornithine cyclodeaminase/alanine dehydrogenase-like protein (mu-crystallin family)